MPAARRAFGYSVRARSFTNDALGNLSAPGTASAVRGYPSTRYLDWHTAPRNARTPTGGARLANSPQHSLGRECRSQYQVLVDQDAVPGLAYRPQEGADANWRRPTLQTRPGIPGGSMPIQVPGTGIPAYCSGCPRCRSFAALRTTRRCGSFPSASLRTTTRRTPHAPVARQ